MALASYRAACLRWPKAKITLRQGARLVDKRTKPMPAVFVRRERRPELTLTAFANLTPSWKRNSPRPPGVLAIADEVIE
jgi:hypothetical protein